MKRMRSLRLSSEDWKFLKEEFGSYTAGIETAVALVRNGLPLNLKLPGNPNLRSAYLLLYNSTRNTKGVLKLGPAKKIVMKELGIQERTAERWLQELGKLGFIAPSLGEIRVIENFREA